MLLNRKMITVSLLLITLVLLAVAIPAMAEGHDELPPPVPHPHMLLLKIQYVDGEPVGFKKCVDLAANRPVPLHAHHEQLHFGDAGVSFGQQAGHGVLVAGYFPTPDFPLPWANCADFEAIFGG